MPVIQRCWAYWDVTAGEFLSVHENTLEHGRNATPIGNEFMRTVNGILETATFGPSLPVDSKIVWVAAKATNTPNCTFKIYSDNSLLTTLTWNQGSQSWLVDLNVAASKNVSIQMGSPMTTAPVTPLFTMGLRWRLGT